jgi:hypothetical protein
MPKQPTWEDLGGTPGIAGARPVGTYDVDAYARGAKKIATAGEHFGRAVEGFGEAANEIARRNAQSELTNQSAVTYARLIGLRSKLRNDPNYGTLDQRWHDGTQAIIDDGATGISHPLLRERFQNAMGVHVAQEGAAISQQAFQGAADAHAARREEFLQHIERNSSLDPNDALLAGGIDAVHAQINDAVARGYLTPEAALSEKRNAALRIGIAHYKLMARVDPERTVSELGSPDSPNPNVQFFPDAVKQGLLAQAQGNQRARQVDAERAERLKAQGRQRASDEAETRIVSDLVGDRPTVTTDDIVNNEALAPAAKPYMVAVAERAAKPDPPATISNITARQLLDRVRLQDRNPDKIANLNPVYDAYVQERLGKDDFNFVRKEFFQRQTPEGENLLVRKQAFLKGVERLIDMSDPPAGKIDQSGRAQMYLLERDLDQKIDQSRRDGNNPVDLFDPSKPDYVGSGKALSAYRTSLQQRMAERINQVPSASANGISPEQAKTIPLRKRDETADEYLQRTRAAATEPSPNSSISR